MYKIQIKNQDWQTKPVKITDRTYRVLKNGKVVPTQLAMYRKAAKI